MRSRLVLACVLCCCTASIRAQNQVRITPIHGEPVVVRQLRADGPNLEATLASGALAELPLDDLASLEVLASTSGASRMLDGRIWLRSGIALAARVLGGEKAQVQVDLAVDAPGSPAMFELRHVAAIRATATDGERTEAFDRALDAAAEVDDLLFAWNPKTGELTRARVKVLGFDGESLRVDFRGPRSLPLERVYGIVFGKEHGAAPAALPRPSLVVGLDDGTRLPAALERWGEDLVSLRLAEGPVLRVPEEAIGRIEVRSTRVERLSRIEPDTVTQVPAFDRVRPWLRNAAPGGAGLLLGGRIHDAGLCLIPRTTLGFALEPGSFETFESLVGIDERSTNDRAHTVLRIRLDGETVFSLDDLRHDSQPQFVSVPLGMASRLELEVDFGRDFDLGDHCVFVDPRLVRH